MFLNHEELKSEGLIDKGIDENYDNASYDLRVGNILTVDGEEKLTHKIEPNSMIVVVSKEKICLPDNRIGHAFIKTRLSQRGIMANNIGIIDSQYNGYLSTVLTNFGKKPYEINEDDHFLRITVSKFKKPKDNIDLGFENLSLNNYTNMIKSKTVSNLDRYFININKTSQKIVRKVKENHTKDKKEKSKLNAIIGTAVGLFLTAAGLFINIFVNFNNDEGYNNLREQVVKMQETYFLDDVNKKKLNVKLNNLDNMDLLLYKQLDSISGKLDKLILEKQ